MKNARDEGGLVLVVARVKEAQGASCLVAVTDVTYHDAKKKLPGGRLKVGENPVGAGIRELKEETRLDAAHASSEPRIIGTTTATCHSRRTIYPVHFMGVWFSPDYVRRTLAGGLCEGKLASSIITLPMTDRVRDTFLVKHLALLREVSEETYTDLLVPTYAI